MKAYKSIFSLMFIIFITVIVLNGDDISLINLGSNNSGPAFNKIDLSYNGKNDEDFSELKAECNRIVEVAYKEIGNVGGEKYWSWYGFNGYAPWCCCFVSWCADQCGYIKSGIIPKFASVTVGESWFMSNGQWIWSNEEPSTGMIIFFDFTNSEMEDVQDGIPDHVGIVRYVLDGYVYCIEGNYHDTCSDTKYPLTHRNIFGYGVPNY